MSVTDFTLARSRSQESYSVVNRPVALFAMLSLLTGAISAPFEFSEQKSYCKAVEVSSSCCQASQITVWGGTEKPRYRPRTALGEKLIALRNQAIAKGLRLLNADEITEEILRRRGEIT